MNKEAREAKAILLVDRAICEDQEHLRILFANCWENYYGSHDEDTLTVIKRIKEDDTYSVTDSGWQDVLKITYVRIRGNEYCLYEDKHGLWGVPARRLVQWLPSLDQRLKHEELIAMVHARINQGMNNATVLGKPRTYAEILQAFEPEQYVEVYKRKLEVLISEKVVYELHTGVYYRSDCKEPKEYAKCMVFDRCIGGCLPNGLHKIGKYFWRD